MGAQSTSSITASAIAEPKTPPGAGVERLETELKYALPATRAASVIQLLERLCDPDPSFPMGIVSSIYFDTRDWTYLQEKRNSDYLKTKVRLRWYRMPAGRAKPADTSFAEAKFRVGSKRSKVRVMTEHKGSDLELMALEDPRLLQIPPMLSAGGAPIRQDLFPSYVVSYTRRRYVDRATGSRIAIDHAIGAPRVNRNMVPQPFPCVLPQAVLEVKGTDGRIPPSLHTVLRVGCRKEAFSKYYECYRHLTRTLF